MKLEMEILNFKRGSKDTEGSTAWVLAASAWRARALAASTLATKSSRVELGDEVTVAGFINKLLYQNIQGLKHDWYIPSHYIILWVRIYMSIRTFQPKRSLVTWSNLSSSAWSCSASSARCWTPSVRVAQLQTRVLAGSDLQSIGSRPSIQDTDLTQTGKAMNQNRNKALNDSCYPKTYFAQLKVDQKIVTLQHVKHSHPFETFFA